MTAIEETVEIAVPVRTAYDQWTQFKSFPRFAAATKEVVQRRPNMVCWVVGIGPLRREFEVEIVTQQPDRRVEWRSMGRGARHRGEVTFRPLSAGHTEFVLHVRYEPRGPGEVLGAALGVPRRIVRAEIGRFKEFIEGLGEAGGAWRGSISNGRVQPVESAPPRSQVPKWPTG